MAAKQPVQNVDEGSDVGTDNGGGFAINFGAIKGLDPIDDGKYDVVIREAKPGESQSGNDKIDLTLIVEDHETFEGRRIYDTLSLAPNALWRVKAFLLALGYEEDFNGEVTPEELVGERLVVTVATEIQTQLNPATGKPYAPRPRVKAFSPAGSNVSIDNVL